MTNQIIAGIVLYNPKIDRLIDCITSIKKSVGTICFYDNGSSNIDAIKKLLQQINDVEIVLLGCSENKGIGYALNRIFDYAEKENFKWVLTLDQDTICPTNILDEYRKYLNIENVGVFFPNVIDMSTAVNQWFSKSNEDIEVVERGIQSGSLVNVEAWNIVGKFDEWMFIDFVDFDFCKKMMINNYILYRCNKIIIDHEFGEKINTRYYKEMIYLHNKTGWNFFKLMQYKNVYSAARVYYTTRNNIAYIKKYKQYLNLKKEWLLFWKRIFKKIIRSKNRGMIINNTLKGIKSGLRAEIKQYK